MRVFIGSAMVYLAFTSVIGIACGYFGGNYVDGFEYAFCAPGLIVAALALIVAGILVAGGGTE